MLVADNRERHMCCNLGQLTQWSVEATSFCSMSACLLPTIHSLTCAVTTANANNQQLQLPHLLLPLLHHTRPYSTSSLLHTGEK